jgi:hypothetical protein
MGGLPPWWPRPDLDRRDTCPTLILTFLPQRKKTARDPIALSGEGMICARQAGASQAAMKGLWTMKDSMLAAIEPKG